MNINLKDKNKNNNAYFMIAIMLLIAFLPKSNRKRVTNAGKRIFSLAKTAFEYFTTDVETK